MSRSVKSRHQLKVPSQEGSVTRDESKASCGRGGVASAKVRECFEVWDSDGDGKLTTDELRSVIRSLALDYTEREIDRMCYGEKFPIDQGVDLYTVFNLASARPSKFHTEAGVAELNQAIQTLSTFAGTGFPLTGMPSLSPRPGTGSQQHAASRTGRGMAIATTDTNSVEVLKFWLTTMGDEFTADEFDTLLRECSIPAGGGGRFQPSLLTDKITEVYNRLYAQSSFSSMRNTGPPLAILASIRPRLFSTGNVAASASLIEVTLPNKVAEKQVDVDALRCKDEIRKMFARFGRENERIVRSTLKEVSEYDDNTKATLRIFHLQELSGTAFKDGDLRVDKRYLELRKGVVKGIPDYNPSQLTAVALAAGRLKLNTPALWTPLLKKVVTYVESSFKKGSPDCEFSHSQLCLILFSAAKSKCPQVPEPKAHYLIRVMVHHPGLWNGTDMAWLLYFMRQRKLIPRDPRNQAHHAWSKAYRYLAFHFNEKLSNGKIPPKQMCVILHEFSKIGLLPTRAIHRMSNRVKREITSLDAKTLTLLAVALGRLKHPDVALLRAIGKTVSEPEKWATISDKQMAMITYAYSRVNLRSIPFLRSVCDRLANMPESHRMQPLTVVTLAFSFATLGIRDKRAWKNCLIPRFRQKIKFHSPQHLAAMVNSMAKVGVWDDELAERIAKRVVQVSRALSTRQICNILNGFIIRQVKLDETAFVEVVIQGNVHDEQHISKVHETQMARVMFGLILEHPEFMDHAAETQRLLINRFSNHDITDHRLLRQYHLDLAVALEALGCDGGHATLVKEGPYCFDAVVSHQGRRIGIQVLGDSHICPVTGSLLGPIRSLRRHCEKYLGLDRVVFVKRRVWAGLPSIHLKRDALYDVLTHEGGCDGLRSDRIIEEEEVNTAQGEIQEGQQPPIRPSKRLRRMSMARVLDEPSE
ncbi:hypothetical protein FOL47_006580 [Perkinsus chesapeaki]|uniref:EF-hand domain-containing protein n=1 Tax=Perkinsus chesapeaki TaxID=330153 RepID=A0A7J6MX43_PERCH|nr:hypothetical protein FOL47_006580 [Perkinsus chesapeaki]